MKRSHRDLFTVFAALTVLLLGLTAYAGQALEDDFSIEEIPDSWSWSKVRAYVLRGKEVIELSDASIIIEVNSTDGDAGFQVFLDGDGWRNARVYDSIGRQVLHVSAIGGLKNIGGGTELFIESSEPEYEDLDGMLELIELLPEGEYYFLARTTDNNWATGTAEFTHDVPAGPEILNPIGPENEDGCVTGVFVDSTFIEWSPVTTDIFGEGGIEIEGYQVIVEADDDEAPHLEFSVTVPAATTMVSVPPEALAEGFAFTFEVLAIEASGNQTITESCFETAGDE
jgi:hypothetical protein